MLSTTDKRSSALAVAYYALDGRNKGPCGLTERARFKQLVCIACQIEPRTWYWWLEKPNLVTNSDRITLSLLFNIPLKELFSKQYNLPVE
jgi:hypothetical protein